MEVSRYASRVRMNRTIKPKHVIKRWWKLIINVLKHNDCYLNSAQNRTIFSVLSL